MVASVGIAATAFLFTLQPALAFIATSTSHVNHILAKQFGNFNKSSVTSFCPGSSCLAFQTTFSNSSCFTLNCLCTASVVNDLETCMQCAVSVGAIPQSDITNALNQFIDGCAEGGFPISGLSSSGGLSGGNGATTVTVTSTATGLSSTLPANTVTATTPTSTSTTVTFSAEQEISISAPVAPVNTGSALPLSAAESRMSISIMTTTVLGVIVLL